MQYTILCKAQKCTCMNSRKILMRDATLPLAINILNVLDLHNNCCINEVLIKVQCTTWSPDQSTMHNSESWSASLAFQSSLGLLCCFLSPFSHPHVAAVAALPHDRPRCIPELIWKTGECNLPLTNLLRYFVRQCFWSPVLFSFLLFSHGGNGVWCNPMSTWYLLLSKFTVTLGHVVNFNSHWASHCLKQGFLLFKVNAICKQVF